MRCFAMHVSFLTALAPIFSHLFLLPLYPTTKEHTFKSTQKLVSQKDDQPIYSYKKLHNLNSNYSNQFEYSKTIKICLKEVATQTDKLYLPKISKKYKMEEYESLDISYQENKWKFYRRFIK